MAVEIRWSKKAERKFESTIEYLRINWGEQVAIFFIKKTFKFLRFVADFPEIGAIQNKGKGIRSFTLIKQINIFYQTNSKRVLMLDFFDNRQKPENISTSNIQEDSSLYSTSSHKTKI